MRRGRGPGAYRIAAASFFIAFLVFGCAAVSDPSRDGGMLILAVVDLCLSLTYGHLAGGSGSVPKRRRYGRRRRGTAWRS